MNIDFKTPKWAEELLKPKRYKGAKGGRGSGKSHFFGEMAVEAMILNPDVSIVCIREVQKSLKFSAKKLIEEKISKYKLQDYFDITQNEIRAKEGDGIMIFQGMQDHTADSIKSLEGFNIAWVEEAQSLSKRSLQLLKPTIRDEGSEIWFSWNPDKSTDPVDAFFSNLTDDMVLVHINSENNPFLTETLKKERENDRLRMTPEDYSHVWEGQYNTKSEALIFKNKYEVNYFEPQTDWTRLQGLDWGFSNDPTTANVIFIDDENLYIRHEANQVGLELDDTANFILKKIPNFDKYITRADNARPESISYVKRMGLPLLKGCKKWSGSVEDGVEHMKTYHKIIIHPDCKETIKEFGLYSYKVDKRSGEVTTNIEDSHNHHIDDIRYALEPMIKKKKEIFFVNM